MRRARVRIRTAFGAALVLVAACSNEHPKEERPDAVYTPPAPAPVVAAVDAANGDDGPVDWESMQATLRLQVDSVDRKLRRVPGLTRAERTQLRRDVNAIQIERAKQLGIRPVASIEPLVRAGQLVRLEDSTRHWVVRDLQFSAPYVTPSAEAMLVEIGERFQARLDSLGLPHYRLDITSVLRTPENQSKLRRRNSNASRTESAHEFGTTVDIAYRRYAAPEAKGVHEPVRSLTDSLMVEAGRLRSGELQAILGRVLKDMQQAGKLMVRMERRQTVYHITVAKPFPSQRRVTAG